MIERIVLVKLNDEHATPAGRAEVADRTREVLRAIDGPTSITVGLPAEEKSARSWDLSIIAHFERVDQIAPYLAHPDHRSYVDEFLAPRMSCIKAWNFER